VASGVTAMDKIPFPSSGAAGCSCGATLCLALSGLDRQALGGASTSRMDGFIDGDGTATPLRTGDL
jgi:hypothetical protein